MKDKMDDIIKAGLGCFTIVFGIVGMLTLLVLLRAYVIYMLWGWFVTPFGISQIGYAHSFGLGVCATYLLSHLKMNDDGIGSAFIQTLFVLVSGQIAHLIMVS